MSAKIMVFLSIHCLSKAANVFTRLDPLSVASCADSPSSQMITSGTSGTGDVFKLTCIWLCPVSGRREWPGSGARMIKKVKNQ